MADDRKISRLDVDFAALRTLKAVHELGSFSQAARHLDVNQSTVSYTIERLRQVFGDPLFIRAGRSVKPTKRCLEVVKGANEILSEYQELVIPKAFDPASAKFKVVFAHNHQQRAILLPRIIRYLRKVAPGVRLQLIHGHKYGHALLREGQCDILVSPIPHEASTLYRKHLYNDSYVCVVDRDSPFAKSGITLEDFGKVPLVLISHEGIYRPPYLDILETGGITARTVLDLSSTSAIDEFIAGTDLVATISRRLASTFSDKVAVIEAPFDRTIDIHMYWTSRTHSAEHMRWVRDVVARAAKTDGDLE